MRTWWKRGLSGLLALVAPVAVWAQVTPGFVVGTVTDAQGGVLPGATVVLISQARGTKIGPVVTDQIGQLRGAERYCRYVHGRGELGGLQGAPAAGGGGERRRPCPGGWLVLEVGTRDRDGAGHRRDAADPGVERRALVRDAHQHLRQPAALAPEFRESGGVQSRRPSGGFGGATRLGGGGQNNYQMDGVSTMDTGNNGQLIAMNMEAIAEVKVLTSGVPGGVRPVERPADHGRDQGRHEPVPWIAVPHRAELGLEREQLGEPEERRSEAGVEAEGLGVSVGGPIGRPGGDNSLFFFYSHEYRPRTSGGAIRGSACPPSSSVAGTFRSRSTIRVCCSI